MRHRKIYLLPFPEGPQKRFRRRRLVAARPCASLTPISAQLRYGLQISVTTAMLNAQTIFGSGTDGATQHEDR